MTRTTPKRRKLVKKFATDSKPEVEKKIKKTKKTPKPKPVSFDSDSDSDLHTLLEPFSKDQLVSLLIDVALSDNSLLNLIKSTADKDVSHRKIFAHGLGWDATRESVGPIFSAFGEIEDINVVTDRVTGRCKGFAFITFKTRKSATKLLKNPKITIGNRITSCQLASAGPTTPGADSQQNLAPQNLLSSSSSSDYSKRKIYVSKVPLEANPDKLRVFFEKFGEIESGPTGLDPNTGKFKGYAIFVFKTLEGAKQVLEEPSKIFEGSTLNCRQANEGKKMVGGTTSITTGFQPVQPEMFAAVAAAQQAQNLSLLGQQPGISNSVYGSGMLPNVAALGALMGNYYGMMGNGMGVSPYGAYSVPGVGSGSSNGGGMLQGLQYMYPSGTQGGQTSSMSRPSRSYSPEASQGMVLLADVNQPYW